MDCSNTPKYAAITMLNSTIYALPCVILYVFFLLDPQNAAFFEDHSLHPPT